MDDKTLRQVQLVQLEMAKEIKRVCDTLKIDYWLDGGTLLGAIRHKGFIPWDDDLDVAMKRDDYERFLREAPGQLSPAYELLTWEKDRYYGLPFAKIQKKGTLFVEETLPKKSQNNGIFVDIMPYDLYPDDAGVCKRLKWKLYFYKRLMLSKCGYRPWKAKDYSGSPLKNVVKRSFYILLSFLSLFTSKDNIRNRYESAVKSVNTNCDGDGWYPQDGATDFGEIVIKSEWLERLTDMPFEDGELSCPEKYDKYLKAVYGDYWQLPPEEERVNRHNIKAIRL